MNDILLSFLDNTTSQTCSCTRINVNYVNGGSGYVPEIFGNYRKADEPSDKTGSELYVSEYQDGKYGIWKCNHADQWFIGLQSERGLCEGYAYINSTSKCLLNVPKFGWRMLEKVSFKDSLGWTLVNANSFKVQCNLEGKSTTK